MTMTTTGETDLPRLLRALRPARQPGRYVFGPVPTLAGLDLAECLGFFREAEACTVILPQAAADHHGLSYSFVAAWLTLRVHSALDAVGLTAAVSEALTRIGVSCNVVAAFYHDHLFVAEADAERALAALEELAAASGPAQESPSAASSTP